MNKKDFEKVVDILSNPLTDYQAIVIRLVKTRPQLFLSLVETPAEKEAREQAEMIAKSEDKELKLVAAYLLTDFVQAVKTLREYRRVNGGDDSLLGCKNLCDKFRDQLRKKG